MNRHCLFVLINFSVKFPATKKKTDYDSKLKQKKISQIEKNTEIEIGPKKVPENKLEKPGIIQIKRSSIIKRIQLQLARTIK
ncbi:hypothetical protein DERP_003458 [Dermatophagoides pteronyssinus]|uniref:Uncharacterized protein n=1 Tax=Dermatophagoides pteronyssinus TaxID=6956 RepID=A0ABQ8JKP8_DERPT|nr:hypothetical protein DERP_003458 [Dermatophagoides pteronyssinus]